MAREYDRTGTNSGSYSLNSSTPVTTTPLSMAGWFYLKDDTYNVYNVATVCDSESDVNYFALAVTPKADPASVVAVARGSSGSHQAISTTGVTLNQWHHGCAVFHDLDERDVYIDGGSKGTDSGLVTPSGIDRIGLGCLGRSTVGQQWKGYLAEVAIWNVALTDNEAVQLSAGCSPLFVRPNCLVCYWPMIRRGSLIDNLDLVGDYSLTDYNSPTDASHCCILSPATPLALAGTTLSQGITPRMLRAIENY